MAQPITKLSTGDKVKFGKYKVENESPQDIVWQIADKSNSSYPSNAITLLTNKIIDIRGFDAKEPSNSDSDRRSYGNNRYKHSNIRQWLNKSGKSWYTAQHSDDEPPTDSGTNDYGTGYQDHAGFLEYFTNNDMNAIMDTNLTVAKADVDGGGSETVTDKVFLLSKTEVDGGNENGVTEGSPFPIFSGDLSKVAQVTKQVEDNSNYNTSGDEYWWLRTPLASYSNLVRVVNRDGSIGNTHAYYGNIGVRPALNLKSEILVSDSPDSDGAHTVVYNSEPTISGQDKNLGEMWSVPSIDYKVNDTDAGDTLTVTEKLDGSEINKINDANRDKTYKVDLSNKWSGLSLGEHNVTVTVGDGQAQSTRKYSFTKTANAIKFEGKNPIETSIAAQGAVLTAIIDLAAKDKLKILACNNAFDASPSWEDATQAYKNRESHTFANNTKTAKKWGINYRVELTKVNKKQKSYIDAVGINFGVTKS